MRTLIKRIPYPSRSQQIRLCILPDTHLGNAACDEIVLADFVQSVKDDEWAYWIGAGDYCEFISLRDKRFDVQSLPNWLTTECRAKADGMADPGLKRRPLAFLAAAQRDSFIERVRPIAPKCLGLLEGNHERTMALYNEQDVYSPICEAMGASAENPLALDMCGFLRLSFQREPQKKKPDVWTYDIYLTHGWWNGQLMGNGVLNLERVFGWAVADCVIAGHDHKAKAFPLARVYPRKNGETEQRDGWCVGAGTFLGKPRYMEQARPLTRGWIELIIEPDKRRVRILQ